MCMDNAGVITSEIYVPLLNLFHKPCFDQKPCWRSSKLRRKSGIEPKGKSYAGPWSCLHSSPGWGFHPASVEHCLVIENEDVGKFMHPNWHPTSLCTRASH